MENFDAGKFAIWLISACGVLVGVIGGLVKYVYSRHVEENDKLFNENREDHKEIRNEIRENK
jgi:hypothetical protein